MKCTITVLAFIMVMLAVGTLAAGTEDLGDGFFHHGVATPVSNHRGTVATVDGTGRDVVLVWLFDHRGGYALLLIDAETGKSEQFPVPFPPGGDCPYASILSSGNRFYTHFNSYFVFDAATGAVVYERDVAADPGLTAGQQGPRIFVRGPAGEIYLLFLKGIALVDPTSHALTMLAESPVPIHAGGDYLEGSIYFASGSHLYSYRVKK